MGNVKLTLADQVLINALSAVMLAPMHDEAARKDNEMMRGVIAEVLPFATRAPVLQATIDAAEAWLGGVQTAEWHIRNGLADIMRWRCGLALDRFRNQQIEGNAA